MGPILSLADECYIYKHSANNSYTKAFDETLCVSTTKEAIQVLKLDRANKKFVPISEITTLGNVECLVAFPDG